MMVDIGCFEYGSVKCLKNNLFEEIVICEGESYKDWTVTGEYTETLVSASGCDSTVVTNLTVVALPKPAFNCINDTLSCNEPFSSYQWHDQNGKIEGATSSRFIIEKSGTYYLEVTNSGGCASVSEGMNIIKTCTGELVTEEIVICEGDSYNGWTATGEYTENLVSALGCDSTVVTNLTVVEVPIPEFICHYDTLSCNESFSSYQWHDQNGRIEGATTPQFIIEKSGTYYLEVTNANGCASVSEGMTVLKTSTRELEEFDFDVVVMPNPANDYIKVRITNGKPGKYQVQLINGSGQLLHLKKIVLSGKTHEVELNVSHFSKGNYFVWVKNGNKRKIKKVLLK